MLTDETALLRQIIREEMKSVLKEIGLHDDDAGNDVRDLRSLITDWRGIKKTVWQTVARAGTMFVLGLLTFGAWMKVSGGDGGQHSRQSSLGYLSASIKRHHKTSRLSLDC